MKRTINYILLIIVLVAFSCKKNPLPDEVESESPVFYVQANVNGTHVRFEAGKQEYYMYSSHHQQNNGVYVYKAELKQSNCTNFCGYGISFSINDVDSVAQNSSMKPQDALFIGQHPFNDGNLPALGYYGTFVSPMPTVADFTWTINGSVLQTTTQAMSYYFDENKTYTVGLKVNKLGCESQHNNVFKVGNPLQGNIGVSKTNMQYNFSAMPNPTGGNIQYTWDFGDGTFGNSANEYHEYQTPGDYMVKLTMIKSGLTSDTCLSHYLARASTLDYCHANFTNAFTPKLNSKALSAITINLTDPATGAVYSSSAMDQSTSNSFEIVSVEDYKMNANGDATKKIKIRFNCSVKSNNSVIQITNGEAVLAVSYK
ncbi:MAG: PKD domain-containing protein [Sphingobacteriaceae bacterium]|nr:PKD domain-containing protein [Sphingobacteriaceae bacterium]